MTSFIFINKTMSNNSKTLFDFKINLVSGEELDLSDFKGKSLLLVNVASNCGFTKQYNDLQKLHDIYNKKGFMVLAVPSNQFGGQEPGSNNEIKEFCETNFNITFPITSKYDVKGDSAHPIYKWAKDTYGNSTVPKWNFHKILINKEGRIEDTFASFTNPMSKKVISKIEKNL
tara:strand:- start:747 stop:1265 length:519 start_codon:yes stop_codon:yes gene_type:complete